jgi:hypothetical protein
VENIVGGNVTHSTRFDKWVRLGGFRFEFNSTMYKSQLAETKMDCKTYYTDSFFDKLGQSSMTHMFSSMKKET